MVVSTVAQFRTKYVFLAPTDYDEQLHRRDRPDGRQLEPRRAAGVDGPDGRRHRAATASFVSSWAAGNAGAHVLTASDPVGLEVMGYGSYTSYTYPGGLDLKYISPPPA
jgi:hypothetical protein